MNRKMRNPTPVSSNQSWIYIYYKAIETIEQEEYVLFDFWAILAAVGGSMGLFLGFSFLDFGYKIIQSVGDRARRHYGYTTNSQQPHVVDLEI